MLYTQAVLLLKEESTFGTDPTPDASNDAILVVEPIVNVQTDMLQRDEVRNDISQQNAVAGRQVATVTFGFRLRGSGTAGTAPVIGAALKSCGMSETVDAGVSVTYAPVSSAFSSCTIMCHYDGLLYTIVGCRGTWALEATGGGFATVNFTFTGRLKAVPTDTAIPSSPTLDTIAPAVVESCSLSADGDAMVASTFSVDAANNVVLRESVNAAEGFIGAQIVGRAPTFSMNPEVELEATHAFWGKYLGGSEFALSAAIGATAGNICTITAPKAQYTNLGNSQRNNQRIYDASLRLNRSSGNDELVLAFT